MQNGTENYVAVARILNGYRTNILRTVISESSAAAFIVKINGTCPFHSSIILDPPRARNHLILRHFEPRLSRNDIIALAINNIPAEHPAQSCW